MSDTSVERPHYDIGAAIGRVFNLPGRLSFLFRVVLSSSLILLLLYVALGRDLVEGYIDMLRTVIELETNDPDDPAAAMAVADAVIVASIEAEAFGRAAVEAGALEKPVIVTRIGAVGETVLATPDVDAAQRTGWKVTPNDASEMATAIREVLALSQDERSTVGRRARRRGIEQFSLQQMCEKTLAVYDDLLAKKQ